MPPDPMLGSCSVCCQGTDMTISMRIASKSGKVESVKLSPGAVIVTAMRLPDGIAREFISWLKTEGFGFPVIAIVDNLGNIDAIIIIRSHHS